MRRTDLEQSVAAAALLALVAPAVLAATAWDSRASLFPLVIGIPLCLLLTTRIALALRSSLAASTNEIDASRDQVGAGESTAKRRRTLAAGGWILAFVLLVIALGFPGGGPLATLAYLRAARETWILSLAVSAAVVGFLAVLTNVMHLPFPNGLLFALG